MAKMLEVLGLVLTPLFWGCAGATLMIIIYRKKKNKKEGKED
jgi:hypothetical protein